MRQPISVLVVCLVAALCVAGTLCVDASDRDGASVAHQVEKTNGHPAAVAAPLVTPSTDVETATHSTRVDPVIGGSSMLESGNGDEAEGLLQADAETPVMKPTSTAPETRSVDEDSTPPSIDERIIGGAPVPPNGFPYVVSLTNAGATRQICGAALLSRRWAITAAHCVRGATSLEEAAALSKFGLWSPEYQIVYGHPDVRVGISVGSFIGVDGVIAHPSFNDFSLRGDIALLRLAEPGVLFDSTVQPIALSSTVLERGQDAFVAGWGLTIPDVVSSTPDSLMYASVNVQASSKAFTCGAYAPSQYDSKTMVCAGCNDGSRDGCQGDSGSPLAANGEDGQPVLVGIVSWGIECSAPQYPGVYVRISAYVDWIQGVTSASVTDTDTVAVAGICSASEPAALPGAPPFQAPQSLASASRTCGYATPVPWAPPYSQSNPCGTGTFVEGGGTPAAPGPCSLADTCSGAGFNESLTGGCFCDPLCVAANDCCSDACSACGSCPALEIDTDGAGFPQCGATALNGMSMCGTVAPVGCWCTQDCDLFGMCCWDACEACGLGCASTSFFSRASRLDLLVHCAQAVLACTAATVALPLVTGLDTTDLTAGFFCAQCLGVVLISLAIPKYGLAVTGVGFFAVYIAGLEVHKQLGEVWWLWW